LTGDLVAVVGVTVGAEQGVEADPLITADVFVVGLRGQVQVVDPGGRWRDRFTGFRHRLELMGPTAGVGGCISSRFWTIIAG